MMSRLDEEIRAVEVRIARGRTGLATVIDDCEETARDAVAAPKNLLAVAALGFALGEMLRPAAPARSRGVKGLLAGAALALIRARYGSPWVLARQIWTEAPSRPARGTWHPGSAGAVSDAPTAPASR